MLFYNLEFRSRAIEPHLEKLPEDLAQVNSNDAVIFRFTGAYLNPIDSFKQHVKLDTMYVLFTKLKNRTEIILHVMQFLFGNFLFMVDSICQNILFYICDD